MKKLFPEYFQPDETEIKQIWNEGLIALDANVLLNLYRYSAETREEFLKAFKTIKTKEDWWQKVKGRTLGPRSELIAEFWEHSGQMFHMYLPDNFLNGRANREVKLIL
jgi:hypothetical protein